LEPIFLSGIAESTIINSCIRKQAFNHATDIWNNYKHELQNCKYSNSKFLLCINTVNMIYLL